MVEAKKDLPPGRGYSNVKTDIPLVGCLFKVSNPAMLGKRDQHSPAMLGKRDQHFKAIPRSQT